MRIIVLSDPHGNLIGLDAGIAEAHRLHPDVIVCGGDIAHFGPQPNECVDRLIELGIPSVRGNHDRDLLEPIVPPPVAPARLRAVADIHNWGNARLSERSRQYLAALPFSLRYEPAPGHALLVVHGSPDSDTEIAPQQSPKTVPELCAQAGCEVIVAGHQHAPFIIAEGDFLWVNAGSCGASTDGDPRGALAVLDWAGGRWNAEIHRYTYDLDEADRIFQASSMPHGAAMIASRRSATWFTYAE